MSRSIRSFSVCIVLVLFATASRVVGAVPDGLGPDDWDIIQQAYLKASNTEADDRFGFSVAASGDTVVVGAWLEDSAVPGVDGDQGDNSADGAGAAYVFVRNGATWSQQAYLKASNPEAGDQFGWSVAVSGDTVVVGARLEAGGNGDPTDNSADGAGAAYVFVRDGASWSPQAYLKASIADAGDQFGGSVAVSGDTVVVGAGEEDSQASGVDGDPTDDSALRSGAAYVFVRSGTTWSQQAYLKASNPDPFDDFGRSVAVSGDTVVVGVREEDSGVDGDPTDDSALSAGAVYVFVRNGTSWSQQAYLKASPIDLGDRFGDSVAVAGDTLVIGAPDEDSQSSGVNGDPTDNSALRSGAAYVFGRSGGTWTQQAYLKASNPGGGDGLFGGDRFGAAVGVTGDVLVVGALFEESAATGVNGDESDDSADNAGAAYVFVRSGGTWTQQAYLKASNTDPLGFFGGSVSATGDTVVVGSVGENSSATGVNGDETDNSALSAGAAYVFDLGATWVDLGYALPGTQGAPVLEGSGSLVPGTPGALELSAAAADAPALLLISPSKQPTPFLGGTLVPFPFSVSLAFVTGGAGDADLPFTTPRPAALPSGSLTYLQCVIQDAGAPFGAALSNALEAEAP